MSNKDRITVIEEMVQAIATDNSPDMNPVFVGPMYDIRDTAFTPTISSYTVHESYLDGTSTLIETTETAGNEIEAMSFASTFLANAAYTQKSVYFTVSCSYEPEPGYSSNAIVRVDNLRTEIFSRPGRSSRFTVAGAHLHDDAPLSLDGSIESFYDIVQKDDVVVLPTGPILKIKNVAGKDLYFYDDTLFDENFDLPINKYSIYRYLDSVDVSFSSLDGVVYFDVEIPIESLSEATFSFFDKQPMILPVEVTKFVPGEYNESLDNPLAKCCVLSDADTCYYIPINVSSDWALASEILHDSWVPYTIVPLTDESSIISLFIPGTDFYSSDEIKIVLATTPLVESMDVSSGFGAIAEIGQEGES